MEIKLTVKPGSDYAGNYKGLVAEVQTPLGYVRHMGATEQQALENLKERLRETRKFAREGLALVRAALKEREGK
jgi:pyrroloquinoline quinone (PQQ) biosynthesis protein C